MGYACHMIEVRETDEFSKWLRKLNDRQARARIHIRIDRLRLGLPGDVKPVGNGVSELRIDYGPGYRVYFTQRGDTLVFLLIGGDKRTQKKDIETAIDLAQNV
jgi:putative addiction module killer protein